MTTMLAPAGRAPVLAPFGHCPFCNETVRLFRHPGEAAWRCRGCGLRARNLHAQRRQPPAARRASPRR